MSTKRFSRALPEYRFYRSRDHGLIDSWPGSREVLPATDGRLVGSKCLKTAFFREGHESLQIST